MRIADSADWRSGLPFESAVLAAEAVPGEDARCFACGPDVGARSRDELWAYKHRHPKNHSGFVRFYCSSHVPVPPRAPAAEQRARTATRSGSRSAAPRERATPRRAAAAPEPARPVCPDCFVEATAAGGCSMCGNPVG